MRFHPLLLRLLALSVPFASLSACGILRRAPTPVAATAAEGDLRLAAFPSEDAPVRAPVRISWDAHGIPFIEAESDHDAAVALGMVHAHLRLGQIEVVRRAAQGRLSESVGFLAADVDHALRLLDLGRGVPASLAALPPDVRLWLRAFCQGLNHVQSRLDPLPWEHRRLGIDPERWTPADVLLVGRLVSIDVNWLGWVSQLQLEGDPNGEVLATLRAEDGVTSRPSFASGAGEGLALLLRRLGASGRTGSNAFAISGERTASGAPLFANDPHLGFAWPNFWIAAGVRTPTLAVTGLMVPGVPAVAVGRNEVFAFGGTNMRSASSDLVEVPLDGSLPLAERRERLEVRGWADRELTLRDTPFGPLLSDAELLGWDRDDVGLALHWVGHGATGELTALHRMNRARDFSSFREAFRSWHVSGQNYLYADVDGNVGQVMAVGLPERRDVRARGYRVPVSEAPWGPVRTAPELPFALNPRSGFLASANNLPTPTAPVTVGFYFAPDQRIARLEELLGAQGEGWDMDAARAVQGDSYSASSLEVRDALVAAAALLPDVPGELLAPLEAWDGHYRTESEGAAAFELAYAPLAEAFWRARLGGDPPAALVAAFGTRQRVAAGLREATGAADLERLRAWLAPALDAAAGREPGVRWGDLHRLRIQHPFGALPLVGRSYRFVDAPVPGAVETLWKSAHAPVEGIHTTSFGAQARFLADLADLDASRVVLLGGQDGWLGSAHAIDQVDAFLALRDLPLPLRAATARARSVATTMLAPRGP
ncbi:MAG: penicillin acylase family protein [Myxococcota bacterium]